MTSPTYRDPSAAAADRQVAQQLQAARFRLMIDLARGTTPSREVSSTFEQVSRRFGRERGVAAELGS